MASGHSQPDGFAQIPTWTPEEHVAAMDRLRIQTSLLSISSPGVLLGAGVDTVSLAREVNEAGPGDVIFTGTPAGVGATRPPARFLQPGQVLESWVEGVGTIRNRCV